jgi:hypothetical protein
MAKKTEEQQIFSLILKLVDAEARARKLGLIVCANHVKEAISSSRDKP